MNPIQQSLLTLFSLLLTIQAQCNKVYFQNEENFNFKFSDSEKNQIHSFIFYHNAFLIKEFSNKGLGLSFYQNKLGYHLKLSRFGNSNFSENTFQFFTAYHLTSALSLSLGVNAELVSQKAYKSQIKSLSPEFRLLFNFPSEIHFNATLRNSPSDQNYFPNQFQFSIDKQFTSELAIKVGSSATLLQPSFVFLKSQYNFSRLLLALQLKTNHTPIEFATGINFNQAQINCIITFHEQLGISTGVNIQYKW